MSEPSELLQPCRLTNVNELLTKLDLPEVCLTVQPELRAAEADAEG